MGIGGTSLVYCGILERIPSDVWDHHPVFAKWPAGYSPKELHPYYQRVEEELKVHIPDNENSMMPITPRAVVMDEVCKNMEEANREGKDLVLRNLRVGSEGCRECGWCTMGCKYGAKMDMARTYIPEAKSAGALFVDRCKVMFIRKAFNGYNVYYNQTSSVDHDYHLVTDGPLSSIWSRQVIIAAGSPESPALLMRSRTFLNQFPDNDLGLGDRKSVV